jgi:predicted PurR-regulated permease PerM
MKIFFASVIRKIFSNHASRVFAVCGLTLIVFITIAAVVQIITPEPFTKISVIQFTEDVHQATVEFHIKLENDNKKIIADLTEEIEKCITVSIAGDITGNLSKLIGPYMNDNNVIRITGFRVTLEIFKG